MNGWLLERLVHLLPFEKGVNKVEGIVLGVGEEDRWKELSDEL